MSMESVRRIEATRSIEEAAARWLARRDAGNFSPQEERDFDAWMNESMAHRVAYWRLQDAWENALRLKALGAGVHSPEPPPPGKWNLSPFFSQHVPTAHQWRRPKSRALAAGLAALATAAAAWFGMQAWNPASRFETPVGAIASLPIEDGSTITLNTDSKVEVVISETERRIELQQGEAFFEVAKDPARPFVVSAGSKRVIAVGTSFSVRRGIHPGSEDIQVVVTEGAVRIESATGGGGQKLAERRLTAGHIARTAGAELVIERRKPGDAQEELSWRSGVLVFRDATLGDAAAEFNRYNKRKIVIEDPEAAALTIAGSFRTTNVDSFVEVIGKGYPVRIVPRNGDFLLIAERRKNSGDRAPPNDNQPENTTAAGFDEHSHDSGSGPK
jgi:transmembrane sensor